jgi:hypothetical protein
MAQRSTTSQYQPSPPNYAIPNSGVYRNVGRYRRVYTGSSPTRNRANMSTAPINGTMNTQYKYSPRVSG